MGSPALPPRTAATRRSRSRTPTTRRRPRPTWASTGTTSTSGTARRATAASARSTRAAARPPPPPTGGGGRGAGWAQEISLDLDMVSAVCPKCHILLVEASSNSYANLAAAVDTAAALGATQISNSYGGGESFTSSYERHYNHPGVLVTASSGDSGYGVEFPASSPHVTAVGGTTLSRASNARGWWATVWNGAGSGCSSTYAKPSWQHDTGCSRRSVADVSAVANPNTGVAVYDSYAYQGASCWMVFGGTSVAAPVVAAVNAI